MRGELVPRIPDSPCRAAPVCRKMRWAASFTKDSSSTRAPKSLIAGLKVTSSPVLVGPTCERQKQRLRLRRGECEQSSCRQAYRQGGGRHLIDGRGQTRTPSNSSASTVIPHAAAIAPTICRCLLAARVGMPITQTRRPEKASYALNHSEPGRHPEPFGDLIVGATGADAGRRKKAEGPFVKITLTGSGSSSARPSGRYRPRPVPERILPTLPSAYCGRYIAQCNIDIRRNFFTPIASSRRTVDAYQT